MIITTTKLPIISAVVGILVGLTVGWVLWSPKAPTTEIHALAVRQKDRSLILEKDPNPNAKPQQEMPKGAVVERVVKVVVRPKSQPPLPAIPGSNGMAPALMPSSAILPSDPYTVTVDLTLARMPDGTRRVIASSPDGEVIGGLDIPTVNITPHRVLKNAIGMRYVVTSDGGREYGPVYHRDLGWARLTTDLTIADHPNAPQKDISVSVGFLIRF